MSLVYTTRIYYYAGSTRIAMREVVGQNSTLNWLLTDHLGSQSITANADGSFHSEVRYTAFGETRYTSASDTPSDRLYTGQRLEEELGLYYYGTRFYDAYLNHFIQPDTIVAHLGFSLSYIRYAYVHFNPICFFDPSGHKDYPGDGGYYIGGTTYGGSDGSSGGQNITGSENHLQQPRTKNRLPTQVIDSNLTYGGMRLYRVYLQMFNTRDGWWWRCFGGGFTVQNYIAICVFYTEGSTTLKNYGNSEQNGFTLIAAWSEGAARAYYNYINANGMSDSNEGLLNWAYNFSQSAKSRANNVLNLHHSVKDDFVYTYDSTNAFTVANNFFNPESSWKEGMDLYRPFGWGNNSEFLSMYSGDENMTVWCFGDFFIPTGQGSKTNSAMLKAAEEARSTKKK